MNLNILPLSKCRHLREAVWDDTLQSGWPKFMRMDPVATLVFSPERFERLEEYVLIAFDPRHPQKVIARGVTIPFCFGPQFGRQRLPQGGWDAIVHWAVMDEQLGRSPNSLAALEVLVHPDYMGQGLSGQMLSSMRTNARRLGFMHLYAPVRPSQKHLEPSTPITDYAYRTRDDGLPTDDWLRVHVRSGGRILGVAEHSMTIPGTLEQWRSWTRVGFNQSGPVNVPGALVPVHVSVEQNHAVYVEPNVWVHHSLESPRPLP